MAKLSYNSGNNQENENKEIREHGSLSIKKTNVNENTTIVTETSKLSQAEDVQKNQFTTANVSHEAFAKWLLEFLGTKVFENIKANPHLQLPYTETSGISIEDWLVKALKTIFPQAQITDIGTQIFAKQQNPQAQNNNEKVDIDEKLQKANIRFQQMQDQIEDLESEKFRIEKELNTTISLQKLVNIFFKDEENDTQNLKKLRSLLFDAIEHATKETSIFVTKLSRGWVFVQQSLQILTKDEKVDLEIVYEASKKLLSSISGTHISERRSILDIIANIISENFNEYEFISGEQTLQIDPSIHNAQGLGSQSIKESVSFAVIRKASRQAVKYADIKV